MRHAVWFVTCCLLTAPILAEETPSADFFLKKVVPVLQHRCLSCHNSLDRKGDFALQTHNELRDSGFIEPGVPNESALLNVLTSVDGKRPSMPKNGEPLKPEEVAAIREWIARGAEWPDGFRVEEPVVDNFDWWSLQPLRRPKVPSDSTGWSRTPVDAFILAKLGEEGLSHSGEADRRTLIRRLTYDLIGLPPTPAEVEQFINDLDPLAYERLVDRLLDSPHYGERWARHWLDVVKYADTCGYDKDKLRPNAWPYRDYVIRSFNDDKPYARFVQEQVAGDVLFPGTADGILGLGFIAAGPWDFIGHVEVSEAKIDGRIARHIDRDEMVTNTLNTFCSATVQCARCHNHKFDPFTQEHYYSLQSVFAAVDRAERRFDTDPHVERRRRQLEARLAGLSAEQKSLDAELQKAGGDELASLDKRLKELKTKASLKPKRPEYGFHSNIEPKSTTQKWVQVDLGREVDISKIVVRPCHDEFGGIGAGFGFPVRFKVAAANSDADLQQSDPSKSAAVIVSDNTSQDFPNPGLAPFVIEPEKLKARFVRVTATKLVERQNDFILALAELQILDRDGNNVALQKKVTAADSIQAPVRWARKNLVDGIWPEAQDESALAELADVQKQHRDLLAKINTPERQKRKERINKDRSATQNELNGLPKGRMVYAAASDFAVRGNFKPTMGKPRLVRVLHRGNILQPRDEVRPGTVPVFQNSNWQFDLPAEHNEGDRRAALARWITRPDHPLTWRSIVNRVWQYHFGRGIVSSPNDFGRMGQRPTHPKLLDWLATEFRDNGQSFKKLHRLIVTSATYRQTSAHSDPHAKLDGSNRFLWRTNRRRLEAEEIRDSMLAVSGTLNGQMNGSGYYLFVLEKTAHSPHYEYHKFDHTDVDSYRRSVYRFIVRSQPDPYMTTLDCADSSQSTPKRSETMTALQALSMLNNRFSLQMAERFASRVSATGGNLPQQLEEAFRLATGRSPDRQEREQLQMYAQKHGLQNLCRVLFNLSEFVFVD